MENMILMGDIKIPKEAISRQIARSVDLIVQVKRLRDGSRRTTNITEVIGMEGDVIVTQELFKFEYLDETDDGKIIGEFRPSGLRPYTLEKARQFGFDQAYLEACLSVLQSAAAPASASTPTIVAQKDTPRHGTQPTASGSRRRIRRRSAIQPHRARASAMPANAR
jgi:hypothetical protein